MGMVQGSDWCELTSSPLDSGRAIAFVSHVEAGGVAVFLGTTRAEDRAGDGQALAALDYEAYGEMATRQLRELAGRARQRWPMILKLAVLHRLGRVAPAEPSVLIAVSTSHRGEAFAACQWLIDTLKAEVAIWKKEVWGDGRGTWVDPAAET